MSKNTTAMVTFVLLYNSAIVLGLNKYVNYSVLVIL